MPTADSWDRVAGRYDWATAPLERPFLAASRAWACTRASGRTLEVGIGTGANLRHYPLGLDLTGVDLSPAMLEQARQRARDLGVRVALREGNAEALPFASASFDTVVCTLVLCSVPSVDASLAEMARVLKPGGSLLLVDHVVSTAPPVRWAQRGLESITGKHGEYWTRRPSLHLARAGLAPVASDRLHFGAIERVHAERPR
ncbi:MAG TPA: SAM-dependent methyltransferase [Janibacter terrae]|nr:SAM-dependent methyltransferase [Janibacter terrae]